MERTQEAYDLQRLQPDHCQGLLCGSRILVVEDEVLIAMELQSIFEDEGAEVIGPAFTLARGMDLAKAEHVSAAVLDVRLGEHSVGPVARVLAERNIPFLFYSGQPPDDPARAEWPQSRTIAKPATGPILVDAVLRLVQENEIGQRRAMQG